MATSRRFTAPQRCDWPGVGGFAVEYGTKALQYLRDRSREDPWWAAASIVMHAGRVNYNSQQPIIEEIVPGGPAAVETVADAIDTVARVRSKMGRGPQDWARIAAALPVASACYRRFCQLGSCSGKHGKLTADGHSMIECMRSGEHTFSDAEIEAAKRAPSYNPNYKTLFESMVEQKVIMPSGGRWVRKGTGIGAKSRNLMAEYLGCDNAVAVDTHVANWVSTTGRLVWIQPVVALRFDKLGRPVPGRNKDGSIKRNKQGKVVQARETLHLKTRWAKDPRVIEGLKRDGYHVETNMSEKQFAMFKREFQAMADQCGTPAADLQVGAWAQGTCEAVSSEGRRYGAAVSNSIYLGKGKTDSCANVPRFKAELTNVGVRMGDLPGKAPPAKFSCKPGYFGGTGNGNGTRDQFRITNRIAPPSTERWKVKQVGKPFPARQLAVGMPIAVGPRRVRTRPVAIAG